MAELEGLTGDLRQGVYIFRGPRGEILYVGKSTNLRRRVLDHLREREEKDVWIRQEHDRVEFIPTRNEREALLLEANLVREYQPRYNVLLKDDKSYPYIAITAGERFPRISMVRRPRRKKGTLLFGPYTSAREARSLVEVMAEAFLLRRCRTLPKVACLYYHMGTCSAPCIGAISQEAYTARIDDSLKVLRGHGEEILPDVQTEMAQAAARLDFERAAKLRDAIAAMDGLRDRQRVVSSLSGAMDLLEVVRSEEEGKVAAVGLVRVREGQVVGADARLLAVPEDISVNSADLVAGFLLQDYVRRRELPPVLYVAPELLAASTEGPSGEGPSELSESIALLTEQGVEVRGASTGRPRSLLDLARSTARARLATSTSPRADALMEETQQLLGLPGYPRRIEGIDISILQGTNPVGSLVVFVNGSPAKSEYRRFRIKGVPGMNDFAMVGEVVRRRFTRLREEGHSYPDLLLIDGGAGQVGAAADALRDLGITDVPLFGLAKREEEIYRPGRKEPLRTDPNSGPMLLLRHVRDESHRFAVGYHRKRRQMAFREEKRLSVQG